MVGWKKGCVCMLGVFRKALLNVMFFFLFSFSVLPFSNFCSLTSFSIRDSHSVTIPPAFTLLLLILWQHYTITIISITTQRSSFNHKCFRHPLLFSRSGVCCRLKSPSRMNEAMGPLSRHGVGGKPKTGMLGWSLGGCRD